MSIKLWCIHVFGKRRYLYTSRERMYTIACVCQSCNTGHTFLRVIVLHNVSENFLNLFKLCVPRFDKQDMQRNLRGDGAWHKSPSSRGPPMRPNQLSVICCLPLVVPSLSFTRPAAFFLSLPQTGTKHCHWTITCAAQIISKSLRFPSRARARHRCCLADSGRTPKIKRDVPSAIELTVRSSVSLPLFIFFFFLLGGRTVMTSAECFSFLCHGASLYDERSMIMP